MTTSTPTTTQTPVRFISAGGEALAAALAETPDATVFHLSAEQGRAYAVVCRALPDAWAAYSAATRDFAHTHTLWTEAASRGRGGGIWHARVAEATRRDLVRAWYRLLGARTSLIALVEEAQPVTIRPVLHASVERAGHWPPAPVPRDVVILMARLCRQGPPPPIPIPIPFPIPFPISTA